MNRRTLLRPHRALLVIVITNLVAFSAAQPQDLLIRGAQVHTETARGTLEHADVLVRGGRVVAVGSDLTAGPGASVVEANGRPLTPGLFGGITALGIEEVSLEPSTVDSSVSYGGSKPGPDFQPRPEFDVSPAFNADSVAVGVNRVEGITYTMVAPTALPDGTMFAGQGAIARLDGREDAFVVGSRTLFIDLGDNATEGSGKSRAAQFMLLDQATRESLPGRPLAAGDLRLLTPTGREVLARYLAGGRIAFAVDRAADIRQVLAYAARNGVHPVIVGGAQAWQVAALLAKAQVPVVLNPLVDLPGDFDQLGATMENAARLHRAGVTIGFTTGETQNARKVRQAAGVAVAHGLPWDTALAGLTSAPAEIFGVGAEVGRIAPGYAADLVLWSGDPLEVTTAAEMVWIGGDAQSMRSRQTELRDRYRPNTTAPTAN